MGSSFAHLNIAVNAGCRDAPKATIYSYGKNNHGATGNVNGVIIGTSAATHATDIAHWLSLGTSPCNLQCARPQRTPDTSPIPAPDADVEHAAQNVIENTPYSPFGGPFGTNSNSAAAAVANHAAGSPVPLPRNGHFVPGAPNAGNIGIRPKRMYESWN